MPKERKGKIQLIDASHIFHKLRKSLGNKRNEISPEDRKRITELYFNFTETEESKIFKNTEFIYREYTVMQPLQRSYAINDERIENLLMKNSLSSLYDEAAVNNLENSEEELSAKDQKKLEQFLNSKPVYDSILSTLKENISYEVYNSPEEFMPVLFKVLSSITQDKKLLEKIADGLSVMDKKAQIQRDKKGNIIYDKETKDSEIVNVEEDIDTYMAREVLPYVPDAKAFFEENLGAKKPVIKTGAEITFTRYFYKYEEPRPSDELLKEFLSLEESISERLKKLMEKGN